MFRVRALCNFLCLTAILCASTLWVEAQSKANSIPRKLTLMEAEELLLQRNLSVMAARYQVDAGRAARLIAGYKPNPVVTVGLEQVPFYSPLKGSFPRFWNTNSDAGANPVYTFRVDKIWERGGKRELRGAQADAQVKASEAQMLDAIRAQVYQLRQAFAVATLARENMVLAQNTQQQYDQTERLTQIKVTLGDQAGVELYRVRAGRLQFQQAILQAHTSYEQAARDVLNLLGLRLEDLAPVTPATPSAASAAKFPPTALITQPVFASLSDDLFLTPASEAPGENAARNDGPAQDTESLPAVPLELVWKFDDRPVIQTLAELREMALNERPDVKAMRHTFEAAEITLRLARAQRTRDVDVAYEYQRVGNDHAAGMVVQIPLFTYNNQRAGITQAEAQMKAAEALLKQTELQAITDVEKAYQSYRTSRRMLDLYSSQNLTQVEKLRSIATYGYKEGGASLLELLDAQRYYNQALTAYNQARADFQSSLWQLEYAVGHSLR